jgi:hypothetical protein
MCSRDFATVGAEVPMLRAVWYRHERVALDMFEYPQHGRRRTAQTLDLAAVLLENHNDASRGGAAYSE